MPRIEHDKGKIESHKLAVQQILNALSTPSSSAPGNVRVNEPKHIDATDSPTISGSESGRSLDLLLVGRSADLWFPASMTQP